MGYLFTSESVSEGRPDKVADQIWDAVLDKLLAYDPSSKVACETLVTTGQVVLAGEVKTKAYVDLQASSRAKWSRKSVIPKESTCSKVTLVRRTFRYYYEQSPDINRGVERQDPMNKQVQASQGMMFGYATNETENSMPLLSVIWHTAFCKCWPTFVVKER